ncbi:hypothetical protein Cp1R7AA1_073 [Mesorhizobium phage Cp1R7A-A1]|nr:hypothetical protein Cp1R7AA1_073 [Mesorhizobium phage Cp1R7A-A1]
MKKLLLSTLALTSLAFVAACTPETPEQVAKRVERTSTEGTTLVAVIDGCRLFRVDDPNASHDVYFSHCPAGGGQTDTSYETGGKTSYTVRSVGSGG